MKRQIGTAITIGLFAALLLGCSGEGASLDARQTETPNTEIAVIEIKQTPAPTPMPTPTASPTPDPNATPAPTPFSIVWLSDTQHYSELHPEMLLAVSSWINANKDAYNIQALVHSGDMVNRSGSSRQWTAITNALDALEGVPFLALAGNHDVGTSTLDYGYFKKYVASRYTERQTLYDGGRGAALPFETNQTPFLLIGTGWGYNDRSVAWLQETIAANSDRYVILCCHSYLDENGTLTDGGDILFEKVVKRFPTVRLVISGHRDGVALRADELDDNADGAADRTVYAMLYNYQEVQADDGGGYMRILTVDMQKHTLTVKTYSPYLDDWKTGEAEQFVLPFI